MPAFTRRPAALILGMLVTLAIAIQFAGPSRRTPSAEAALALDRQAAVPPRVRDVLARACYDCHSHATRWPWYARVAPASWLVISDVEKGREHLNFSTWGAYHRFERADLLDRSCELASNGTMPLRPYTWLHPGARLAPADVEALCAWTRAESERLTAAPNE